LKLSVSKIPEEGIHLRYERDGEWFRRRIPGGAPCDFLPENIQVDCTVRRMRETVFAEGTVSAALAISCCRCLEPASLPVGGPFRYTFAPPPAQPTEECELTADDLEFAYYEEDTIDLDGVVFEQILLQIPLKPLCRESCRGLCPHCGINRNEADCRCESQSFDERLAVLKRFKVQPEK
jgi:uncharacterized protein